ncbi:hypothetical protein AWB79_00572 [Caballeronia hypogeia]|uniref:Uncharacterized protein n=1 Tax=Caballeronia hypogeia TaxID=1777140 RepID=A0A157ZA20_9BURK|nr:hypothetical protein AWB79_00572 [Caballeronia hypogeia]
MTTIAITVPIAIARTIDIDLWAATDAHRAHEKKPAKGGSCPTGYFW